MLETIPTKIEEVQATIQSISAQLKPGERCKGCVRIGMGKNETKIKFDLKGRRK